MDLEGETLNQIYLIEHLVRIGPHHELTLHGVVVCPICQSDSRGIRILHTEFEGLAQKSIETNPFGCLDFVHPLKLRIQQLLIHHHYEKLNCFLAHCLHRDVLVSPNIIRHIQINLLFNLPNRTSHIILALIGFALREIQLLHDIV